MIEHENAFWLVRGTLIHAWSFAGCRPGRPRSSFPDVVTVRTPRATVATLRGGYQPACHPSAASPAKPTR